MINYPNDLDLRRLVRFSAEDGTIWLAEHRMVLLHTGALAGLRKELLNSVGLEHARRVLTRMGYESGVRDAELAKKLRAGQSVVDAFVVGPQLHMLEGIVKVTPLAIDMDVKAGRFYGEFQWDNSWEAESHVKEFGPQKDPVCWMLLGYASGYTTTFMGRFILFKETQCVACGDPHCHIVGKPVEEWPDAAQHTVYYEADSIVSRLLELRTQVDALRSSLDQQRQVENLIGSSPPFRRACDLVEKAAKTNVTVLLTGETGVGKERFARALHDMSKRADRPFVAVNCAALPHDLVESELFGVEKGAFTGAHATRAGKFERAEGGTLFLDEIGELPLAAQAKILRVLQEGEIERLGDDQTRKVNVRIVAATNVELQRAVKDGRFRADLYYRLNVYPIEIPPLRERALDIPPLVNAMIEKFNAMHGKRVAGITDKAMKALKAYQWPGNVRELENMIERGIILAPADGWIELEHLFPSLGEAEMRSIGIGEQGILTEARPLEQERLCDAIMGSGMSLDDIESMLLREAVERSDGNLAGAARMLGLTRPQLTYRLKRNQDHAPDKE
ncbi:MAG TPA: sigma 54-interacting transcriptional regulator [Noviherbaspirillum sp.]|uniref:sigma 54-interacting transcriptional regulator n=1 Tax=Noviherbaspirillum sp. TaxID=1926288 RepID=UPI002B49DC5E|nr:sigma 54-interacting transcriptional regulator [Noviherbaspirillum sp.]HJV87926.1 sigma 54-interacting transcriptional regulator [Noviherbaspirillum sp.]